MEKSKTCPNCKSEQVVKAGFKVTIKGKKQRIQCQICGKTFYQPKEGEQ